MTYELRLEERKSPRRWRWLPPRKHKVWNCYEDGRSLDWDYPEWAQHYAEEHRRQCAAFELTVKRHERRMREIDERYKT